MNLRRLAIRSRAFRILAVAGLMLVLAVPGTAQAQSVQLLTPYPAVSVEAGKTVNLSLEVRTATPRRVTLQVLSAPPGWKTTLRGGGFVIHGVFGGPKGEENQVSLEVSVPASAKKGNYQVVVRASASNASDTLPIDVRVAEVGSGEVTLTAEFESLRGSADSPFNFNITLTNNTPEITTFELAAEGPEGWQVTARPSGQSQATTVRVEGGGNADIAVEASPPDTATEGEYDINVSATAPGRSAEATVTAEVIGNVQLTLTTTDDRLNADVQAGNTTDLVMVVRNDGTSDVENVELTATPPSGWEVTFEPETIDKVEANGSAQVTAKITPAGDAVAGDYVITVRANADGASDDVELRATVETSLIWAVVGILVIAGAIFFLLRVFTRYGRR